MKKINKESTANSPLNRKLRKFYELKQFANNVIKDYDVKKDTMKYCDKEINKCWRYCRENKSGYEIFTWDNAQIFLLHRDFETSMRLLSNFIGKKNRDINVIVSFSFIDTIKTQATIDSDGLYKFPSNWLIGNNQARELLFENPDVKVAYAEWRDDEYTIGTVRLIINYYYFYSKSKAKEREP